MEKIQVLDVHQFYNENEDNFFYSNTLQKHIAEYHKDISIPHKHNFYLCVLFTKGKGLHEIDFATYPVMRGSLFFMNPGQTHHWTLSDDVEGYIFFHSKPFYELYFLHKTLSNYPFYYSTKNIPFIALNETDITIVLPFFKTIQKEYLIIDEVFKQDKIRNLIDLTYIELTRIYTKFNLIKVSKTNLYSEKIKELEVLVEKHFVTLKNASDYAELMHISTKHLNRITQTVLGKTTTEIITDRIILEAKRMFFYTHNSLANVAIELGYEDYAYFSRLFKKKNGESPSDFIKRYK